MRNAYISTLYELAKQDLRVMALIGDNGIIVYDKFRADMPQQFLNMGISEAHMVGFAAGLAAEGKIPFVYTIGVFLTGRAYEFIKNLVCFHHLNVKLVGTGSGQVYSRLGATHHATEDLGCLRSLSHLTVISPASPLEVKKAVRAAYELASPVYLRLGTSKEAEIYDGHYDFTIGQGVLLREGKDVTLIGTGIILKDVLNVAKDLTQEGIHARVINIHTLIPLDENIIRQAIEETGKIITVEDHNVIGGLGSAVAEVVAEYGQPIRFKRMGLRDYSFGYGSYDEVKAVNGIGVDTIKKAVREIVH